MSAERKYNWAAAEHAYIKAPDRYPRVSIKQIGLAFGIPYQSVRGYAAKNKWVCRRDRIYYEARNNK